MKASQGKDTLHIANTHLFPGSIYAVRIPGPQIRYPVLIVHAEQSEQQLLPVRGHRYDQMPHLAVVCLYCGKQVSTGREDIDGVDQRVHDDLVKHQCQSCYIENIPLEQHVKKYRELLDCTRRFYALVRDLSYICPCNTPYPNSFGGFASHIPHCPVFVASPKSKGGK